MKLNDRVAIVTGSSKGMALDIASPEEIAGPVLFLSSEDASYITGAVRRSIK